MDNNKVYIGNRPNMVGKTIKEICEYNDNVSQSSIDHIKGIKSIHIDARLHHLLKMYALLSKSTITNVLSECIVDKINNGKYDFAKIVLGDRD